MQDWLFERDVKLPGVILHDKLMSDALLGTLPIKTEHSYSLNSDGDSLPESPESLKNKIDDMEDECYPAISMNTATSNSRRLIDPTQLTTYPAHINPADLVPSTCSISSNNTQSHLTILNSIHTNSANINPSILQTNLNPLALNLRPRQISDQYTGNHSSTSSIISDIDIDDTCVKDEPMSPSDSSCPTSPINTTYLANIAAFTNTNLVVEHKNGAIHLSPASQSLLKSQQLSLGNAPANNNSLTSSPQRLVIPKVNIKMETQTSQHLFGLPPTPPSSLPSDESEGNQSPEHHSLSPMSPTIQQQQSSCRGSSSTSTNTSPATSPCTSTSRRNQNISTQSSFHQNISSVKSYSGSSTRQPIHTPLISSQPKGSTGTLLLTEEEKRTLLAEGYPIPTRLPLTKAEEKSLKKIRRKIKNKISAQESRRKKKEYMDQLERKVEILVSENSDYRKRVETLEESNANLLTQLAKLQNLINRQKKSN